jgi:transposase InsO family protein
MGIAKKEEPKDEANKARHNLIEVQGIIRQNDKNYPVRALMDSGAEANFISQQLARRAGLTEIPNENSTFETLNGEAISITHHTRAAHCMKDSHGKSRSGVTDFQIGGIGPYDMILGMPWLEEFNPVPNFVNKTVRFPKNPRPYRRIGIESPESFAITALDNQNVCYVLHIRFSDEPKQSGPTIPKAYKGHYERAFSEAEANTLAEHAPHELAIHLEPGKRPPFGPIYPLSERESEVLRDYIHASLAKGWIRRSTSEAGAPIMFAKKKDGGLRLCVDYRGLNAITIKNRHPLPLIGESLDRLGSARIYTKLDLRDAYHRIRIREGDEWKTAFRTRYGHFEYTVMPFGLTNAPAVFQSYINSALSDLLDVCCIVYLDDILIYSKTEEEHVKHVREVLNRLVEHKLYAKLSKCEFHTTRVAYLGFIVSTDGISMEEDRVATIKGWPTPKSVRDVRIFLGFANYYRRFINGFSRIASPLHRLTQRGPNAAKGGHQQRKEEGAEIEIGEEARAAFEDIKEKFTKGPLLAHFDPDRPNRVETDASGRAISGILSQLHQDEKGREVWHPIAFFSRQMSPAEKNYDTHDGELLAIVESFKHWRHYLEGARSTQLLTDHANLQGFMTTKSLTRRQARWAEWLAVFDFSITHRPGKTNPADGPSRRPDYLVEGEASEVQSQERLLRQLQEKLALNEEEPHEPLRGTQELGRTGKDPPKILAIARRRKKPPQTRTKPGRTQRESLESIWDLLAKAGAEDEGYASTVLELSKPKRDRPDWTEHWRLDEEGLLRHRERYYVPSAARLRVLQSCHDDPMAGHFGMAKTLDLVTRTFYWTSARSYVKDYVRSCQACARAKPTRHAKHGELQPLPIPDSIWEDISMDMITDLPQSTIEGKEHDSILVVIDRFSKMAHYLPTRKDLDARGLANLFLREIIRLHGPPKSIVTDRGSTFTSAYWSTFAQALGTRLLLSTAFHPQTDGQTERQNQTVEQYLRIYCNYEQDNWAKLLPQAEYSYNNASHSATGVSPFYAVYGTHLPSGESTRPPREPGKAPRALEDASELNRIRQIMAENIAKSQEYQRNRYDEKHKAISFEPGETVMLSTRYIQTSRPKKKLDDKFWGPHEVLQKIGKQAYKLKLPAGTSIHPVFHVSLLERAPPTNVIPRDQPEAHRIVPQTGQDIYEVDRILGQIEEDGRWLYEVKWKGYDSDENSLLPAEDISKAAMDEYLRRLGKRRRVTKGTRGRPHKRVAGEEG